MSPNHGYPEYFIILAGIQLRDTIMAKFFQTLRWLRPYQSKTGHQVFIRVRFRDRSDINVPIYDYVNYEKIPISVKREHWNKGFVTGGSYHINIRDLNYLLSNVEYKVKNAVQKLLDKNIQVNLDNIIKLAYINEISAKEEDRKIASGELIVDDDGGAFSSETEFLEFIEQSFDPKFDVLKKSLGIYEKIYILDYWDDYIKNFAPSSYNAPKHAIEEFIKKTGNNCKVTEFNSVWLKEFFEYISKEGYSIRSDGTNRQPYTITTIKKYHKHLNHFGEYLFLEMNLIQNQDYKRFKLSQANSKKQSLVKYKTNPFINTHALYKKEFDWFYAFKFTNKKYELVRDMFILQVWLGGMRQVDFYQLSSQNFHKDSNGIKVWFNQQKTDDGVLNTVNQNYLDSILNKYPNLFREFPDVHDYNELLKKAAEAAGLNRKLMFTFEYISELKPKIEWIEIHKKISNNWARNCAVSILSELGYPDDRIAKFTGHKDHDMINHYKSVHKKDVKSMMDEVKPEIITEL